MIKRTKTVRVRIRLETALIREIDALVKRGLYRSRSELIRVSVREMLDRLQRSEI